MEQARNTLKGLRCLFISFGSLLLLSFCTHKPPDRQLNFYGYEEYSSGGAYGASSARGYRENAHRKADSISNLKSYKNSILKDHQHALGRWQSFQDTRTDLNRGAPAPSLGTIMDFVRWNAAAGRGQLHEGGLITADSSNTFMEFFFAGIERQTGTIVGAKIRHQVYYSTRTTFVEEKVVANKHMEKFLFAKAEWQRFNQQRLDNR